MKFSGFHSSQRLGIGMEVISSSPYTTTPASLLTLKSQGTSPILASQRTGASTVEQFKIIQAEASAYTTVRGTSSGVWANIIESRNSNLVLTTDLDGGTGGKIILDADAVGIGTTIPHAPIDVSATGTYDVPTIQAGYASAADRANYRFGIYTTSEGGYISNKNGNDGIRLVHRGNTVLTAGTGGTSATPYVGIGTTAPQHPLQIAHTGAVNNGTAQFYVSLRNNQTLAKDVGATLRFQVAGDEMADITGAAVGSTSAEGGYLSFRTRYSDVGWKEAMRITPKGRIVNSQTVTDLHRTPEPSMRFDESVQSSDRYIVMSASPPSIGTTYSLEVWIKPETQDSNNTVVTYCPGGTERRAINLNASGKAAFGYYEGGNWEGVQTVADATSGKWNHIIGTREGTVQKIYLNGVLNQIATNTIYTNLGWGLGYDGNTANANFYKGEIKTHKIYNVALSADEVVAIYNGESIPHKYDASPTAPGGTSYAAEYSLLTYPSTDITGTFESGTAGWNDTGSSTVTSSSAQAHSGSKSMYCVGCVGSGNAVVFDLYNSSSRPFHNRAFRLTFWARTYTGTNTLRNEVYGQGSTATSHSITTTWTKFTYEDTLWYNHDANSSLVRFYFYTDSASNNFYIDDVELVLTGVFAAYTPQSIGGYQWKDTTGNGNHGSIVRATRVNSSPLEVAGADNGITISSILANRPVLSFECGATEKLRLSANSTYGAIGDSSDSNRYMSFKDGNVGIGTTAPLAPLHIHKDSSTALRLVRGATDGPIVQFYRGSTMAGNVAVKTSGIGYAGGTRENDIFIKTDGNVGIGTVEPSQLLHVQGNAVIRGVAGGGQVALDFSSSSFSGSSVSNYWIYASSNQYWRSDGSVRLASSLICDADITCTQITIDDFKIRDNIFSANTADEADNKELYICAGGGANANRGAYIDMTGNEYPTWGGLFNIVCGEGTNAGFNVTTGGVNRLAITNAGLTTVAGNLTQTAGVIVLNDGAVNNATQYLRYKAATNNYAFTINGGTQGRVGIGADVSSFTTCYVGNTMTHQWTGGSGRGMWINPGHSPSVSQWTYGEVLKVQGAINGGADPGSGWRTHPWFRGTYFQPPTITAGTATVDNSAVVYIEQAMSCATNNYSLYVYSGISYFGGSVGIGTTSPGRKLHVAGDSEIEGGLVVGKVAANATRYTSSSHCNYILLDAANSGGGAIIWGKQSTSKQSAILSNHGKLEIGYSTATDASGTWNPALTVDDAGKVGIGTTAPANKLQVHSATENDVMAAFSTTSNSSSAGVAGLSAHLNIGSVHASNGFARITGHHNLYQDARSYLSFSTNSGSGIGEKMRIMHDGKVGIGTVSPAEDLTVAGQNDPNIQLYSNRQGISAGTDLGNLSWSAWSSEGSTTRRSVGGIAMVAEGTWVGGTETQSAALIFNTRENPSTYAERMRLTGDGNVGIGTTAPVDQLHLASGGKFRNGHGVSRCHNFSMGNDTDYTFTIAGMAYGTAEFHCGFYGQGAWVNIHVTLGGHMYSGAKSYSSTVLANQKGANVTVTLSENNANYVIAINQASGGTTYGSYWFKASTFTDSSAVATVTWASV